MKKIIGIITLVIINCSLTNAQSTAAVSGQRALMMYKNIYLIFYDSTENLFRETNRSKNERLHSYLWPLCGLIQGANELDALYGSQKFIIPVMQTLNLYHTNKPPVPGYDSYVVKEGGGDRFYDDNQWIGLACIDAYKRVKNKACLDVAKEMYRFMMSGYDTVAGGGLYWKEGDHTSKNTCSNGPGVILALQLYLVEKDKKYLDTAKLIYEWTQKNLQAPSGIYYDAIKIPGGRIDKRSYTYNTGTMLQSAVLLYNITHENAYLQEAHKMANASLESFYNGKFPGNYWFNAVLLRGYIELYKVDKEKRFLQAFIQDADRIWKEERDAENLIGTKPPKKFLDQSAMLEIYARIAKLQKDGF
ncbi:MAG: glycoside hydrolase family 76 protein [Chitinophagaceae bacterium]